MTHSLTQSLTDNLKARDASAFQKLNDKTNTNPTGSSHGEQLVANRLTLVIILIATIIIAIIVKAIAIIILLADCCVHEARSESSC